jgi:hypothetical protein
MSEVRSKMYIATMSRAAPKSDTSTEAAEPPVSPVTCPGFREHETPVTADR